MVSKNNNFIIFGRGSSGNNPLITLINSCPNIYCENEFFNPKRIARKNNLKKTFSGIIGNQTQKYIRRNESFIPNEIYNLTLERLLIALNGLKILNNRNKNGYPQLTPDNYKCL